MITTKQETSKQERNLVLRALDAGFTKISPLRHHEATCLWLLNDAIGT